MAGQDVADAILTELDAISWGDDPAQYSDQSFDAVAKGIHTYISDNWSITAIATGIVTPPPPAVPFPHTDSVTVDLIVPPYTGLKGPLKALSAGLLPGFFGALATWLTAPPWMVTISRGTTLNPVAGVSVATFPVMAAQGALCQAVMLGAKPTSKEDAWAKVGNFVYIGLAGNVIPPLPTTGLLGAFPFVGATVAIMTF